VHPEALTRLGSALGLSIEATDPAAIPDVAASLTAAAGSQRLENCQAVLQQALSLLHGPLVPGELQAGWVLRFLSYAELCGEKASRTLASRILAHQILRPGLIRPATLAVAASLESSDMELVDKLARLSCGDFIVRLPGRFLEQAGISLSVLDRAEELGLLLPSEGRSRIFSSQVEDRFLHHIPCRDRLLRIEHETASQQLSLPVFRLTTAGADLAAVLRLDEDIGYVMRLIGFIRRQGFKVTQSTIIGRDPNPAVVRHNGFSEVVPLDIAWERQPA
jgi:hypothetical protein